MAFEALGLDARIKLQIMLTAAGYWNAVPNESFSGRLFESIARFQRDNGYAASAVLSDEQYDKLTTTAGTKLREWGFRQVSHPTRGRAIWMPLGLSLTSERTKTGLMFTDPLKRIVIAYDFYEGAAVRPVFESAMAEHARDGTTVHYKVLRERNFFAISSTKGDIDSYVRFHRDGNGVLGIMLHWKNANGDINGERIAVLMSSSLWSAMTGARFANPPVFEPQQQVAAAPAAPPQRRSEERAGSSELPSFGTGFFVTEQGHILTNAHVVQSCHSVSVTTPGESAVLARVVSKDDTNDLALLKTNITPARVAVLRSSIRLGEPVAAFGFPLAGLLSTSGNFTLGNVTSLAGLLGDTRHIQISAPVQPGNSGGPLLDQFGNVVGVVTSKLNAIQTALVTGDLPENVNFALKTSAVTSFLESNQISFNGNASSTTLQSADLAEHARLLSVYLRCSAN
jgi:S1-C subfamily serine protease